VEHLKLDQHKVEWKDYHQKYWPLYKDKHLKLED
jgi:hypothetical protein